MDSSLPLWNATRRHDAKRVRRELRRDDIDVNAAFGEYNTTPLHEASRRGNATIVRLLLDANADVDAASENGTPLHEACGRGNARIVRLLLAANVNVNATDGNGWTCLHRACQTGRSGRVIQLLLGAGADPNATDNMGLTALWHAALMGQVRVLRELFDARACQNVCNQTGSSRQRTMRTCH